MQGHESLSADALPEESCSIAISTNTKKNTYTNEEEKIQLDTKYNEDEVMMVRFDRRTAI